MILPQTCAKRLRKHFGLTSVKDVGVRIGNFCAQLNVGSVTGPSEGIIAEIYPQKIGEHIYKDDWGVIWRREPGDDIGIVVDPPLKESNLKGFVVPAPLRREKYLDIFCKENPDRFRLISLSSPLFQRAWFLRGFENFMMDMALHKKFVHNLLDMIMEYTSKIIKDKNMFLFFHSCGNIACLIPELIEMGIDVLNPFQPEVMDVYKIKKEYGNRLSFYGGISTQKILPYGTADEVKTDVEEKLKILGNNGGYILAPAHAVQIDVPVENILVLAEAAKKSKIASS